MPALRSVHGEVDVSNTPGGDGDDRCSPPRRHDHSAAIGRSAASMSLLKRIMVNRPSGRSE